LIRSRSGIVATLSLLGTALLTLAVGVIAPRFDLRTLLLWGAGVMAATGLAFPTAEHIGLIAVVPSSARSIPRVATSACWSRLNKPCLRTGRAIKRARKVFARYSLIGALTMAAGRSPLRYLISCHVWFHPAQRAAA